MRLCASHFVVYVFFSSSYEFLYQNTVVPDITENSSRIRR
jgi:hypothetical protein